MRPPGLLAQQLLVHPLEQAYDGDDPLHWLPAWRWTRVNDIWSHRGGGLFTAIKNAVLGVLDIGVNTGFFLASLMWEITTTMLSWALTPTLFAAFEDVVDTAGIRLLDALGFTDAISGASVFAAILLMAVVVALMRFSRNPAEGVKTLLRSFLPLAACAVLVGTTVAEINNTIYHYQRGTTGTVVPGSLKWMYRTLDNGRSLLVEGVVESATLFSSVGAPPGTVYGCDSYLKALEDLYRKDAERAGWGKAQIETPIVVSRMWQAVYLDQFAAAQVGIHSSKRAGCWTAEVREKSVPPIEIFAVWDYTCTLGDPRHHLYGCPSNASLYKHYTADQVQQAEAVFAPSDFDDHEWRSALTLWAMCDWRGRPNSGTVNRRNDLTPGAQRTLTEMSTISPSVTYDGQPLAMLASRSGQEAIFDPAFIGVRNARDSEKYLSAETCAAYRFEHPEDQGKAPNDNDRKVKTPNEDRDGAWGLWAKWVTDRANIEPHDGADSRRHSLGGSSAIGPDSQDREIQKDTVDAINGAGWTGRLMYSVVTVITAAMYGFSLAGMGLGTLIAQFIVGGIVAVMPLLLVLMALPVKAAQQLPRKVFKLLVGALFAHLIFLLILSLVIMCIGILNQVLGGLTGSHFVRSMLFAIIPLIALYAVGALTKQFGLKITSIKGAMLATTGITLAAMTPPAAAVGQYANRARSRYAQISDRGDVRRETGKLEANSSSSGVRTQPRMRSPDSGQPELALNSKSSPAAVAAGALATVGSRMPRGPSMPRGPGMPRGPDSGDRPGETTRRSGPPDVPPKAPADPVVPVVTVPDPDRPQPAEVPAPAAADTSGGGAAPTAVLAPPRPPDDPPPADPSPGSGGGPPPKTQPQHLDPSDDDTGTPEGGLTESGETTRRHRLTEPVETAAMKAGRAAKAAQWGALKSGRWVRDHRRAIKRVAIGSVVAMGAVGMASAAAPLALGYTGAKFVGWRYRRQLQTARLVRPPQERAQEKVDRRQQRETKRQDRDTRVEQRQRRRVEGGAAPPAPPRPPSAVVAPPHARPPAVSPVSAPSPEPPASIEPAPAPRAGSPTEMTTAQAEYLAALSTSAGLDPPAVFEAVAGDRLRASEAIDVLRSGAPPDGAAGTLMDRVTDATSRVRLHPQSVSPQASPRADPGPAIPQQSE